MPTREIKTLTIRSSPLKRETIPAWTLNSGKPGPSLLLVAAQHGNEVQGSEAISRFMDRAQEALVAGRISAVPFANPLALRGRRPHANMEPEQAYEQDGGLNMNRAWPGSPDGSIVERCTHAIYNTFGRDATHVIDLHCWQKHNAAAILLHDLPGMRDLAAQLGARLVDIRPHSDRTLAGYFGATNRPGITYECAGQYTLIEREIRDALRVVTNLARVIGLFPGHPEPPPRPTLFSDAYTVREVKAPTQGLYIAEALELGQDVARGEILGSLLRSKDLRSVPITSPATGCLRCHGVSRPKCDVAIHGHHPFVSRGDLLARIWVPR